MLIALISLSALATAALASGILWRRRGRPSRRQLRADRAEEASIERYELVKRGFTLRWQAASRFTDRFLMGSAVSAAVTTLWIVATSPYGPGVVQVIVAPVHDIASTVAQSRPTAPEATPTPAGANSAPTPAPGRPTRTRPIEAVPNPATATRLNSPSPSVSPSPSSMPAISPTTVPTPSPQAH